MKPTKAVSLAILVLSLTTAALTQSRVAVEPWRPKTASDPLALLSAVWNNPRTHLPLTL